MKKPIRVIEGTAQPHEPFWRFRDQAESESGDVELEFFGPISEYSWWGDEITPAAFKEELERKGKGQDVTVLVNSPGGDVVAASVIRTYLQEYAGKITADIVGLAASAATVMVTGADHVRMRESALFMVHDPWCIAMGNVEELKTVIDMLKTVKDSIVDTYETKTGLERDKLAKLMSDETWMTAREAENLGFIDEVVTGSIKKAQAMAIPAGFANCLNAYVNVPEALKKSLSEPAQSKPAQREVTDEERRLRNEVLLLKGAKNEP